MSSETSSESGSALAPPTFTSCPEWGKGGRFVYDPVTNTRSRVDDAPPAETAEGTLEPDALGGSAPKQKPMTTKERSRA